MNSIKNKIKALSDNKSPDYILFFLCSFLVIISILFSYSLSIYTVDYWDYNPYHFFTRQLITGIIAIIIMWTLSQIKPNKLVPYLGWFLFGFFLFLMVAMQFLPASMVTESGGAKRWIRLPGISLSPVEFFKIGFIYYLAWSFHKKLIDLDKITFKEELKILAPYALVFGVAVFLIPSNALCIILTLQ